MKNLEQHIASAIAHRVCFGEEHNPTQGKIHGFCVICGIPWPCETAKTYLAPEKIIKVPVGG